MLFTKPLEVCMKKLVLLLFPLFVFANVISHEDLPSFEKAGATLTGLATSSMGAKQYEVWRSSLAPGGCTPLHTHASEEICIYLSGKGRAVIGGEETVFEAPCTIICPANVEHQFFNIGEEPSDHILILGIDSTIVDADKEVMNLPWRR